MGRATTDVVDERRQISHVLLNTALFARTLALTVPAPIVCKDTECTFERGDDGIPVVMVAPRAVDENEEIPSFSTKVPEQPNTIDGRDRHSVNSPRTILQGPAGRSGLARSSVPAEQDHRTVELRPTGVAVVRKPVHPAVAQLSQCDPLSACRRHESTGQGIRPEGARELTLPVREADGEAHCTRPGIKAWVVKPRRWRIGLQHGAQQLPENTRGVSPEVKLVLGTAVAKSPNEAQCGSIRWE